MTSRSLRFGSVAAAYEQFRPGYPGTVVDEVLAYSRHPIRTALEIGAGTGKATRAFAGSGITVTATDPDPAMLAVLREHVPDTVVPLRFSFEDLPVDQSYDLVFAAASLHWTRPVDRWPRVAALLAPNGTFASFGGPVRLADPGTEEAVRAARSEFLTEDDIASPDGTPADSALQWPGTELLRSDLFTDVRQTGIERRPTFSAQHYVGYLSTVSAYLELPDPARHAVLDRILAVLPEQVEIVADITVHLARRR